MTGTNGLWNGTEVGAGAGAGLFDTNELKNEEEAGDAEIGADWIGATEGTPIMNWGCVWTCGWIGAPTMGCRVKGNVDTAGTGTGAATGVGWRGRGCRVKGKEVGTGDGAIVMG